MSPGSPEALEAARLERIKVKVEERRRWCEARDTYERSLKVMEQVWGDRLDAAQLTQQKLAEEMRDREESRHYTDGKLVSVLPGEIPVPLFTPRDRVQFLKEATVAFLIFGEKRGLSATPEPKEDTPTAVEAASGTDEGLLDVEASEIAEQGNVTPVTT